MDNTTTNTRQLWQRENMRRSKFVFQWKDNKVISSIYEFSECTYLTPEEQEKVSRYWLVMPDSPSSTVLYSYSYTRDQMSGNYDSVTIRGVPVLVPDSDHASHRSLNTEYNQTLVSQ